MALHAQDLTVLDVSDGPRPPIVLTMDTHRATEERIAELRSILAQHPGSTEVHVRLVQNGRSVLLRLSTDYNVDATEALFGDLKALLGPRGVSA